MKQNATERMNGAAHKKKDAMDFTTGNILQKLTGFMIPILGALILQTMYSAVDILVVGWFGTSESISAVSTGSSFINMIIFVLNALAMGVTVLMGRYLGEGNQHRISRVIGGAIWTFVWIAIILTVLILLLAPEIAQLMQAPESAYHKTVVYIRICGGGIFFIIGYNLISSIFRGIGNSRLPLVFVGIACVINIFADLLFVAVFHWDVAGAAAATVLAQALSLVMAFRVSKKMELPFHITLSDVCHNEEVKQFLRLGFPLGFQEFLTQLSFMAMLAFVNGMGSTEAIRLASSSGYGVANKVVGIIMLVPGALMQSMSSFIAQNVGAGKERRAQKAMGFGMMLGGCIGIIMTAGAFFFGQNIAAVFTCDVAYQMKAAEFLRGYSLEAIVTSVLFSFIGYYNGHNETFFVLLLGIVQSFAVRLPMAYIMSREFPDSLVYVGASAPTATTVGIIICVIYFFIYTKRWEPHGLK